MFPNDLTYCAHGIFPNLIHVMVSADTFSIKTLKEVDQDPRRSKFYEKMWRKKFVDHISSFQYFAIIFFLNQTISLMHHTIYDLFSILHRIWKIRCCINWNWKLKLSNCVLLSCHVPVSEWILTQSFSQAGQFG